VLARRLVVAAWRLERADRIENELFALQAERSERGWGRLGLALVRDGNGARSFDTLLRYRGSAMAELWRALRALQALQAAGPREDAPDEVCEDAPEPHEVCDAPEPPALPQHEQPIEPEASGNPGQNAPAPSADEPQDSGLACPTPPSNAPCAHPCDRAAPASQKCAIMRHLCATHAPPLAGA
jgi:hypothetical protein